MTLNQIMYFQKIAALGNMSKAARALHISQPSLSVALSNLEKELNLQLFHRNGHNLEITPEGRQLLVHANTILADLKAAQMHMQVLSADRSTMIRIDCISPVLWDLLPRVARAFIKEPGNEHIKFDFQCSNTPSLVALMRDGNCDFLICSAYKGEDIQQTELVAEPFVLLCHPNSPVPQTWEELFSNKVIGIKDRASASAEIYNMLSPYGIEPSYAYIAPDEISIASLVSHVFGYGIVPLVPHIELSGVKIAPLPKPNEDMVRRIYVTKLRSHPPVGASRTFLRYLKAWTAEHQRA